MGELLEDALVDSNALAVAAKAAGITLTQAKKLLGELSFDQTIRLSHRTHLERAHLSNRKRSSR